MQNFLLNDVTLPVVARQHLGESIGDFKNVFHKIKNTDISPKLESENEGYCEQEFLKYIQFSYEYFNESEDSEMMSRLDEQPEGSKNFCDAKLDYMKNVGDGERVDRRRTAAKKSYKNYKSIYNHIKKKLNEIEGSHDKYDELVQYYNAVINSFRIIEFKLDSYAKAFEYF